jgi:DNA-binding transcriptional LysR family regulator
LKSVDSASGYLADARLIQVLADWCPYYPGLHLYYPSRRHVPAALKAFIDFAREARQLNT